MSRRVIHSGRHVFAPYRWGALDKYAELPPGTVVDVGAAIGHVTAHLLRVSPDSNAVCFEPNPSNIDKITQRFAGKDNVRVVPAAVADKKGSAVFELGPSALAQGSWTESSGYHPAGMLATQDTVGATVKVPVTTLDDEVSGPVSFLKIDVQGAEMAVLNGGKHMFERGVDLCYIEFTGELDVLEILFERDYAVFDHHYVLMWGRTKEPDFSDWDVMADFTLSTGSPAKYAWPKHLPSDPEEYCKMFEELKGPTLIFHTDIIAVPYHLAQSRGWLI